MKTKKISKVVIILALITGFMFSGTYAQTAEILTNNDVVKLTNLGLAPESIVRKIKSSNSNFDVSVDALVSLKKQGVDKAVINEMINVSSQEQSAGQYQNAQNDAPYKSGQNTAPPQAPNDAAKNSNDPKTWRTEGLYYYNKNNPGNSFVPMDANAFSGMKTGGYGTRLAQEYTLGFARNKQEAVLSGAYSKRQINQANPTFYFYFSTDDISPQQFALVSLYQKTDYRVVIVGSSNYYGATRGIDDKEKVDFYYDKIADGIYKVYTKAPLKPGEYCFMYNGAAATPFSNVVYDFGIDPQ